jgi:hypothetical protein
MRETSLKYIAGNRKIEGQELRLPTISWASDALTLQLQSREQIAQGISWAIQSKH